MPGKGTDINLRRLFLNMSVTHKNSGKQVIASLDAEKAFDSVEWVFLWEALRRFGFGPRFLRWVHMLYRAPLARIRTNDRLSASFPLQRSTRQGCPLSPALFTLALEPLAILIRNSNRVRGLQVGSLKEKISLYADNTLLYLQDAGESLKAALEIFDTFGRFSGIRINWSKSIIFPLDPQVRDPSIEVPLLWVDQFKYLGI